MQNAMQEKEMHDLRQKGEIWLEEPCHQQGSTRANQPHCEVVGVVGDCLFEAGISKVGRHKGKLQPPTVLAIA